jgi:hypothetical protein
VKVSIKEHKSVSVAPWFGFFLVHIGIVGKSKTFPRRESTIEIFFLNRDLICGKKKNKWKVQTPLSGMKGRIKM